VTPRDEEYLRSILDAIDAIQSYAATGEEAFRRERMRRDAVLRNLGIVGEAVSKLSPELRAMHPDVPWAQIVGMRNRLIHGYLTVRIEIVWDTVTLVLPNFRAQVIALLEGRAQ
jgi:uncharacterized protein with HEPN domain